MANSFFVRNTMAKSRQNINYENFKIVDVNQFDHLLLCNVNKNLDIIFNEYRKI